MSKHVVVGLPCDGGNPLWREVQALTAERDDLRSQLATARARADAFQQEANRLRERARQATPRPYLCPYCGLAVTDVQYHEGPEDCRRERVLLGDDTDARG